MAKTKPAANITLSDTIVRNIIELKLKKKRITMKKIAEKLRVERRQVKLVIDRENQRWKKTQALTAMAFVPETENTDHGNNEFEENYSDDDKDSESHEQNEKFEMKNGPNVFGNKSNLVVKNFANGGGELFESQKPRQPNEYSPVSNEEDSGDNQYKKGISEDQFDLENHQEDENFETNNGENVFGNRSDLVEKNSANGGGELFESQKPSQPNEYSSVSNEEDSGDNQSYKKGISEDEFDSEDYQEDEKFEMKNGANVFGNESNLVVKNSANGGGGLFERQKPRQLNEYSPVSNEEDSGDNQYKKGIFEDQFDLEDHQEDEKFETNNGENVFGNRSDLVEKKFTDGGREDFDFEAIQELPQPTQHFADSDQLRNFFESTAEFMVHVRNLESSFLRLGDSVQAKNELIKNKHSDLMDAVRTMRRLKKKLKTAEARENKLKDDLSATNIRLTIATKENHQIEIKLTNALEENQRLKKEYAVLQASQNENKNQCGACQKKLVFTVGNMIVCRSCSDEIKLQFSFHGKPGNTNNL